MASYIWLVRLTKRQRLAGQATSKLYTGITPIVISLTLLAMGLASCKRRATAGATSTTSPPSSKASPKIDACSLITKEEVAAVQETTISDAKSSESSDGQHLITQCYYASTRPNLSVSVTLTQPNPGSHDASGPRQYWDQIFGIYRSSRQAEAERQDADRKQKEAAERSGEKEEWKIPPKKIDGVGEEAYWSGSRVGGALYVLHKDFILRVSIGGPDAEGIKIDKSKALAVRALARF
jgi:hypothetical protein